jgi:hypothetical protein
MIRRRKILLFTAAACVVGFAFAAQPTGFREDPGHQALRPRIWEPGTSSPMSAYESKPAMLPPPQ